LRRSKCVAAGVALAQKPLMPSKPQLQERHFRPINKWDVSTLQDFSRIFSWVDTFNEDISSWNVSNATTMLAMFSRAKTFNQTLKGKP
jgi:L-rhamnose isomerase